MTPEEFSNRNLEYFPRENYLQPEMQPQQITCNTHKEWNGSSLKFIRLKNYHINPFMDGR